jgi:hypothetical protein
MATEWKFKFNIKMQHFLNMLHMSAAEWPLFGWYAGTLGVIYAVLAVKYMSRASFNVSWVVPSVAGESKK